MQRTEVPNNTSEQVREYLREALAIVDELDPADDLRAAVFQQAAQLVSGKQIVMMQPQPMMLPAMDIPRGGRR